MSQHHFICRCCAGRMTVASATNPNVCPGCEQLLADDSPADAAAQMGTEAVDKEEWIHFSPNLSEPETNTATVRENLCKIERVLRV